MTDGFCSNCGTAREPEAGFCASCGQSFDGEMAQGGSVAPQASPPHDMQAPPIYLRPPRNPRQMASYAAAVMILVSGIFALIWGNFTLYWDAWDTDWDWRTDQEVTTFNLGPFAAGLMLVVAFAVAIPSVYCALRLIRYEVAVAGPVVLLIAYFSTLAYEPFLLVVAVEILIMAAVSLALLYYAIPIYSGRNAPESQFGPGGPLPRSDVTTPDGETTDIYPQGPSSGG